MYSGVDKTNRPDCLARRTASLSPLCFRASVGLLRATAYASARRNRSSLKATNATSDRDAERSLIACSARPNASATIVSSFAQDTRRGVEHLRSSSGVNMLDANLNGSSKFVKSVAPAEVTEKARFTISGEHRKLPRISVRVERRAEPALDAKASSNRSSG